MRTEIRTGSPKALKRLDRNARYMTEAQMGRLVENIRRDGKLTSLPLVYRHDDGVEEVLSGNHRVEAAVMAGLEEIEYIVILDRLSEERRIAIQLSHNAINGQDDPNLLAELYASLNLEEKLYSGITDDMVKGLPEIDIDGMSIGTPKQQEMRLVFLDGDEIAFKDFVRTLNDRGKVPDSYLARMETFDRLFETLVAVKKKENIWNTALAFERLAQLARERLDQLSQEAPAS